MVFLRPEFLFEPFQVLSTEHIHFLREVQQIIVNLCRPLRRTENPNPRVPAFGHQEVKRGRQHLSAAFRRAEIPNFIDDQKDVLLAVGAQLERERPWADRRAPLAEES